MIRGKVSARPVLTGKVVGPVITDGGYERGYAAGEAVGYENGHTAGVADGIEQGKQSEYDRFWDAFQQNGTRTDYQNAFNGIGWTDETYKPKYKPKPVGSATRMFENALITRIDLTNLDATEMQQGGTAMLTSSKAEYVEMDIPKCTGLSSSLYTMRQLKTFKLYNMNQCFIGNLIQAYALENVEFDGTLGGEYLEMLQSNLLTYESLQNIIAAAYDYAANPDGKTHRVGLHKDAKAKLSEADIVKLTEKGWTLT